jgi:hypothetical protein
MEEIRRERWSEILSERRYICNETEKAMATKSQTVRETEERERVQSKRERVCHHIKRMFVWVCVCERERERERGRNRQR